MKKILTLSLLSAALLMAACASEDAKRDAMDEPMQNAPAPGQEDMTTMPADTMRMDSM